MRRPKSTRPAAVPPVSTGRGGVRFETEEERARGIATLERIGWVALTLLLVLVLVLVAKNAAGGTLAWPRP